LLVKHVLMITGRKAWRVFCGTGNSKKWGIEVGELKQGTQNASAPMTVFTWDCNMSCFSRNAKLLKGFLMWCCSRIDMLGYNTSWWRIRVFGGVSTYLNVDLVALGDRVVL
jgi:hypothetical protein